MSHQFNSETEVLTESKEALIFWSVSSPDNSCKTTFANPDNRLSISAGIENVRIGKMDIGLPYISKHIIYKWNKKNV